MSNSALNGAWRPSANRRDGLQQTRRQKLTALRETRALFVRSLILSVVFIVVISGSLAMRLPDVVAGLYRQYAQSETVQLTAARPGKIVEQLADGVSCRFFAFDNFTGWVGMVKARCESEIPEGSVATQPREFKWGSN